VHAFLWRKGRGGDLQAVAQDLHAGRMRRTPDTARQGPPSIPMPRPAAAAQGPAAAAAKAPPRPGQPSLPPAPQFDAKPRSHVPAQNTAPSAPRTAVPPAAPQQAPQRAAAPPQLPPLPPAPAANAIGDDDFQDMWSFRPSPA